MFCTECGSKLEEGTVFCPNCGAKLNQDQPKTEPQPETPVRQEPVQQTPPVYQAPQHQPVPQTTPAYQPQPIVIRQHEITQEELPEKFRPLSAWAYVGYSLLFAIPIVGFVFLIVFSCSSANINRRSYARSYWCYLILSLIIIGTAMIILAATGNFYYVFDKIF
jgi:hypothetical protein